MFFREDGLDDAATHRGDDFTSFLWRCGGIKLCARFLSDFVGLLYLRFGEGGLDAFKHVQHHSGRIAAAARGAVKCTTFARRWG